MKVGMVTRRMFFDRKTVVARVDRATRKVFSRFGAYVRTGAKSSIRKRKSVSPPGRPPSSHTGLLKKLIYFGYDRDRKSVVIGPTPLRQGFGGQAPELLEHGGRARRKRRGKAYTATYSARPFMRPAFEREQQKLPVMWRDSVR